MYLDRKAILGTLLKSEEVDVPEWGGKIVLWELGGVDAFALNTRDDWESLAHRAATWIQKSVKDEHGELIFLEDDIDSLARGSFTVLTRLSGKVLDLCGLGQSEDNSDDDSGN